MEVTAHNLAENEHCSFDGPPPYKSMITGLAMFLSIEEKPSYLSGIMNENDVIEEVLNTEVRNVSSCNGTLGFSESRQVTERIFGLRQIAYLLKKMRLTTNKSDRRKLKTHAIDLSLK